MEVVLQAFGEVGGCDDAHDISRGVGAADATRRGEDDEEGHHRDKTAHLRQNDVSGGIDAHNFKGVELLCHAHRADFGGDVGAHLTRQDETHNAGGEFQ